MTLKRSENSLVDLHHKEDDKPFPPDLDIVAHEQQKDKNLLAKMKRKEKGDYKQEVVKMLNFPHTKVDYTSQIVLEIQP